MVGWREVFLGRGDRFIFKCKGIDGIGESDDLGGGGDGVGAISSCFVVIILWS